MDTMQTLAFLALQLAETTAERDQARAENAQLRTQLAAATKPAEKAPRRSAK